MTKTSLVSDSDRVMRNANWVPVAQPVVALVTTFANPPVVTSPLAVVEKLVVTVTGVPYVSPVATALALRQAAAIEKVAEPLVCAA